MKEETKEILEEMEKELLQEEILEEIEQKLLQEEDVPQQSILEEIEQGLLQEVLLEEQGDGPAFANLDTLETGPEPEVFSNFANDYGRERSRRKGGKFAAQENDSVMIILMLIACILSLGIICVMLFWLQAWR